MIADDMVPVVRVASAAEEVALAVLIEARRLLHMRLSERLARGGRLPADATSLVIAADEALAAHVLAVADSADAFRAWSQAREREENAAVLEAQTGDVS